MAEGEQDLEGFEGGDSSDGSDQEEEGGELQPGEDNHPQEAGSGNASTADEATHVPVAGAPSVSNDFDIDKDVFEHELEHAESLANLQLAQALEIDAPRPAAETAESNAASNDGTAPAAAEETDCSNPLPAAAPAASEPAPASAPAPAEPTQQQAQPMPTADAAAAVSVGDILSVLLGREHHVGQVRPCRMHIPCPISSRVTVHRLLFRLAVFQHEVTVTVQFYQVVSIKVNTIGGDDVVEGADGTGKEYLAEMLWDDGSANLVVCLHGNNDAISWKMLEDPHPLLIRNHLCKSKQNLFRGPLASQLDQQLVLGPPPPSSAYALLLDKGVETISDKDFASSFGSAYCQPLSSSLCDCAWRTHTV
eukprot:2390060-Pleurochrysis_carterae.AAC.2